VRVLCTERLEEDLVAFSRARGCAAAVPRLHRTSALAGSSHNMSRELRDAIRRHYVRDAELHDHYCASKMF